MPVPSWTVALSAQAMLMQGVWVGCRLMIGYRAVQAGASPFLLGLIVASFAVPALIAALPVGRLAGRHGGSRLCLFGIIAVIGGIAAIVLAPGYGWLPGAAALIGLGQLVVVVGQQSYVAQRTGGRNSDEAFGTLTAWGSVGQLLGPLGVTAIATMTTGAQEAPDTTAGLILLGVLAAIALLTFHPLWHAEPVGTGARSATSMRSDSLNVLTTPGLWRALVMSGIVIATIDLLYTFLPLWAIEAGVSITAVGWLLALRAAVTVGSRIGMKQLIDWCGRKRLLIGSMVSATAGLISLPFVEELGAAVVMVLLGVGLGLPQPLTLAWVVAQTPVTLHGAALGLRITANRLAQTAIPLLVGAAAAPLGVSGIFWANALFLAASGSIIWGARI